MEIIIFLALTATPILALSFLGLVLAIVVSRFTGRRPSYKRIGGLCLCAIASQSIFLSLTMLFFLTLLTTGTITAIPVILLILLSVVVGIIGFVSLFFKNRGILFVQSSDAWE